MVRVEIPTDAQIRIAASELSAVQRGENPHSTAAAAKTAAARKYKAWILCNIIDISVRFVQIYG